MIINIKHLSGEIIQIEIDQNEEHLIGQKLASLFNLPQSILSVFSYDTFDTFEKNDNKECKEYGYVIDSTTIEWKKTRVFYESLDYKKQYPLFSCYLLIRNSSQYPVFYYHFAYNIQKRTFFSSDNIETEDCFDRYSSEYYMSINLKGRGENTIEEMIQNDNHIPEYFKRRILEDPSLFDKNTWVHP